MASGAGGLPVEQEPRPGVRAALDHQQGSPGGQRVDPGGRWLRVALSVLSGSERNGLKTEVVSGDCSGGTPPGPSFWLT
ncbi:hypothetical protein GCM10020366_10160 [Saccharopolyspora gregorii]|uniref:Uncharacterized protein n=1 Tax=Saccharopolyspora gregorii TaxID=33914 RepID=A0ABP6RNA5_9PSEU